MFDLASFTQLRRAGASTVVFDQCMHGGVSPKPTQLLYYGPCFEKLQARCTHEEHERVVQRRDSAGAYATHALSAYPPELNVGLADIVAVHLLGTAWPH